MENQAARRIPEKPATNEGKPSWASAVKSAVAARAEKVVSGKRGKPSCLWEAFVEAGIISADHVGKFVEFATSRGVPLGEALVELGVCDQKAVNDALLSMWARIRIGELLVERKLVTPADLKRASDEQKSDKRSWKPARMLGQILVENGAVCERDFIKVLWRHLGMGHAFFGTDWSSIDSRTWKSLWRNFSEWMESKSVLPLYEFDKSVTVVSFQPLGNDDVEILERKTGKRVVQYLGLLSEIKAAFRLLKSGSAEISDASREDWSDGKREVENVLHEAVFSQASDVHLEPRHEFVEIRLRRHWDLAVVHRVPKSLAAQMASYVKINSNLDIATTMVPQDGAMYRENVAGHRVDFRISCLPTVEGEKIVLRVLDKDRLNEAESISDLGMPASIERQYRKLANMPHGVIVVTWPTGSWKSTTLYAAVNEIASERVNVTTLEDPVERKLGNMHVNQVQISERRGMTFEKGLEALLRQDPDVILLGEIRNSETAKLAAHAAMTWHLILTTLHTDSAVTAIARLVKLGVDEWLVSSIILTAVNQRLVKGLCRSCSVPCPPPEIGARVDAWIQRSVAEEITAKASSYDIRESPWCRDCGFTWFSWRCWTYEQLIATEEIKRLIMIPGMSWRDIIRVARESYDMNMIFEDGVRLWLTGKIPFSELRSLPSAGFDMKGPDSILADAEKPLEIRPVDVRGIISEYVKYPSKPETVSLK